MNLYTTLASISAVSVLIVGALVVLFSDTTFSSWQNLLIATFILGYAHFVIGFIYQSRSVFFRDKTSRMKIAFIALFLLAAITTLYLLVTDQITLLGIFVVPYFMGHILLNEHTLAAQQTGNNHPWSLFAGVFTWFTALLLMAVPGNSFFYGIDLSYTDTSTEELMEYLVQYAPLWIFTHLPMVLLTIGIGFLLYAIFKLHAWRSGVPLLTIVIAGTIISFFFEPIAYVYLLTFILSYHFTLWMLHFGVVFYERSRYDLYKYIFLHVLIVVPLVYAAVFREGSLGWVYVVFLHSWAFAIVTYVHITLAFLNERWFQRWFGLDE